MKTVKATFLTLLLLICSPHAGANETIFMSVNKYMELKSEAPEEADNYLSGVLSGYILANAMLEKRGQTKLYCVPDDASENKENLNNTISLTADVMKEANKTEQLKESVASLILWSLSEAYPCKQ